MPEHALENRRYWDARAEDWVAAGEMAAWQASEPFWGIWRASGAGAWPAPRGYVGDEGHRAWLRDSVTYQLGWLAGAQKWSGIDNSEKQLATATRLAAEHDLPLTLHHGNAESRSVSGPNPSILPSANMGPPFGVIPGFGSQKAKRILRPGGELVFLGHSPLVGGLHAAQRRSLATSGFTVAILVCIRSTGGTTKSIPGALSSIFRSLAWLELFRVHRPRSHEFS